MALCDRELLAYTRALVLEVTIDGMVISCHGGYGGFIGFDLEGLVGRSAFEIIHPDDLETIIIYMQEAQNVSLAAVALPLPFRARFVDLSGRAHAVDIMAAAAPDHEDDVADIRWIVTAIPVELTTAVTLPLDAELAGAPRSQVKRLLARELAVDTVLFTNRWFLIECGVAPIEVTAGFERDDPVAELIEASWDDEWQPLELVQNGTTALNPGDLPAAIGELCLERGLQRVVLAPVLVDDKVVAMYLLLGRVHESYNTNKLNQNVVDRIDRLTKVTGLLLARWERRDLLHSYATTDPLTGLLNRRSFDDLLGETETGSLLYVDLDDFKGFNDNYGHAMGDAVLRRVAQVLTSQPHDDSLVSRYGGDEFLVLCRCRGAAASDLARSIVAELAQATPLDIGTDGDGTQSIAVGVCIGVAELGDELPIQTLRRADNAMLRAKRKGRGCVEFDRK